MPKKKKKEKPALLQKLINLKNKDTKAKQDPPSPPTALKVMDPKAEEVPTRVSLPQDNLSLEIVMAMWQKQQAYIDHLEEKLKQADPTLKDNEVSKREHFLVAQLTTKEKRLRELSNQVTELKSAQVPTTNAMRNALLDPAVNIIVSKLTQELDATKAKLSEVNEEMSAWKFTPDSVTGKRLMARCRQLLKENEEIAKMVSSGRLAKLEGELAMHKNLVEEMKKTQVEMDDFVQELDEEMEGMQSTIYLLQQQLNDSKEQVALLELKLKETQVMMALGVREATSAVTVAANTQSLDDPSMSADNTKDTPTVKDGNVKQNVENSVTSLIGGCQEQSEVTEGDGAGRGTPSKDCDDEGTSRPKPRAHVTPIRGGKKGKEKAGPQSQRQ